MTLFDKIKRKIKSVDTASLGIVACASYIILEIIYLIFYIVIGRNGVLVEDPSSFLYELIYGIIDIVFYFWILNYFRRAKQTGNFFFIFYAIAVLMFFNYIMPLINSGVTILLYGLFSDLVGSILMIVSLALSSIVSILYFVFMFIENKKRAKTYRICLIILGAILAVSSALSFASSLYIDSIYFTEYALSSLEIILLIIEMLMSFVSFLFSFLFLSYAIDIKRRRDL